MEEYNSRRHPSEKIIFDSMNRDYITVLQHVEGVLDGETDLTANLANVAAILKEMPGYFWVGFYLVKGDELVLGPFQGPVACTRIGYGKGVCGTAWKDGKSVLVPDVDRFPGHIACNSNSKSELVVPIFDGTGKVAMVLDADSDTLDSFHEEDRQALEKVASLISGTLVSE